MLPRSLLIVFGPALCLSRAVGRVSAADIVVSASPQCPRPSFFVTRRTDSVDTLQQVQMSLEPSCGKKMIDLIRLSAGDLQHLLAEGHLTSFDLAKLSL
jgi:hypothetical protein